MVIQILKVFLAPIRTSKTKAKYKLLLDGKVAGVYQSEAEAMRARLFLIDHECDHYVKRQQMLGNAEARTSDVLLRDIYISTKPAMQLIFPDQPTDLMV